MQSEETDIIIVGSGPAGSVLANRLSEISSLRVDLLEAGPKDNHPLIHIPAGFIKMIFNPHYTWTFKTEPTKHTANREINVVQGRVIGGSSSINGLVYNRGQAADFDQWAQFGNQGWDYQSVLPYFMRSENFTGSGDHEYHGKQGPLPISDFNWHNEVCDAFIKGAQELGIPLNNDYNGLNQEGVGYYQRIIHGRRRISAARGFLTLALNRNNLHVRTNSTVTRILFEGRKAIGVEYTTGGNTAERKILKARKQIILSSGTVNTPKLLQISGIGPSKLLKNIGVPVIHSLNGVGQNLRDHYSVRVVARVKNARTINEISKGSSLAGQIARWVLGRPSVLTLSPSLIHIFAKSHDGIDHPDLQGVFSPASYKAGFVGALDDYPGMTCGFWQHRPESTGYIHATSPDADSPPAIQPNYLKEQTDRQVLVSGIKLARNLVKSPALTPFFDHEQLPGKDVRTDAEILDFAAQYGTSAWHMIGTAKMGPLADTNAVVSARLKVHGIDNLSVADASIMPTSPSANTFASSLMIGEKASDMIKEDLGFQP